MLQFGVLYFRESLILIFGHAVWAYCGHEFVSIMRSNILNKLYYVFIRLYVQNIPRILCGASAELDAAFLTVESTSFCYLSILN
jgi:hypothetical protein